MKLIIIQIFILILPINIVYSFSKNIFRGNFSDIDATSIKNDNSGLGIYNDNTNDEIYHRHDVPTEKITQTINDEVEVRQKGDNNLITGGFNVTDINYVNITNYAASTGGILSKHPNGPISKIVYITEVINDKVKIFQEGKNDTITGGVNVVNKNIVNYINFGKFNLL